MKSTNSKPSSSSFRVWSKWSLALSNKKLWVAYVTNQSSSLVLIYSTWFSMKIPTSLMWKIKWLSGKSLRMWKSMAMSSWRKILII